MATMHVSLRRPTVVISSILSLFTAAAATGSDKLGPPDPVPDRAAVINMVNNCFSCHGPDGRSPGAIPSLSQRGADQVLRALQEFKTGARPATVMTRHARGYTDAELEAIAKYIGDELK